MTTKTFWSVVGWAVWVAILYAAMAKGELPIP